MRDLCARFDQLPRQAIEHRPHGGGGRQQRVIVDDEDAEVLEPFVPRSRQGKTVGDPIARFVGTGGYFQRQIKIRGASCHRPDNRKITPALHHARRPVPAQRHEIERRLMRIGAAIMRRHTQRAAEIRAERQRPETGRKRGGRSARRSAGCAAEIPGVVRRAIDLIVALPIAQE